MGSIDVLSAFGLERMPFEKDIAVEALMRSPAFEDALGRLSYSIQHRLFCVFTAPPGCGKSTTVRALVEMMDPRRYEMLYVAQSQLTPRWLYNSFLSCLGKKGYNFRGDGQKALHDEIALISQLKGKQVCCIVDEAHLLSRETVEELRFFLNFRMDSQSPVSLLLCGQNELLTKLSGERYEAIRQRVQMKASLPPLDRSQVEPYMECHMSYAGSSVDSIFTPEAVEMVADACRGIPRMVNTICQQAMVCAAIGKKGKIDGKQMQSVIAKEMIG